MRGLDLDGLSFFEEGLGLQARRLRLNTLAGVRWLAVFGQLAAILGVYFALGFAIPLAPSLACVASSAILNLALRWRFPVSRLLGEGAATGLLGYDILQLALLLYLTGGIANPFAILFLAPVTIAATSLPLRQTLWLLALTLVCATELMFWSFPLPWIGGQNLTLPAPYPLGLWAALAVSTTFVTVYAYRVANEGRQLADALAATELVLARAQHLSQLDGLAAAAAHELGTPLATVSLVVREMAAQPLPDESFGEDLKLVEQSVERCRAILNRLSRPGDLGDGQMEISSPAELIELAAGPHRHLGIEIAVESAGPDPAPPCARNPGVLYGLGNLIENAVSFAETKVTVRASWTKSAVKIDIADDGPGFPTHVLARLGEPYLSSRGSRRNEEAGGGLGLGLFIAKALLERSRAVLELKNAEPPGAGARVTISWPREAYEQGRRPAQ